MDYGIKGRAAIIRLRLPLASAKNRHRIAGPPLTRAAQRRLERQNIDLKCLVVELRSKQYTRTTLDEESKSVDWAWQWAVRGHWRDQPTKDGTKLIWIHPYIKGPEDKPLKPDAGRVFAVTR